MTSKKDWVIGSSASFFGSFDDTVLEEYRKNGVTVMELSFSRDYYEDKLDYFHHADTIFQRAAAYGIRINSIHLPFYPPLDPSSCDEALRAGTVDTFKKYLAAAGKSGVKVAVIHPSFEPIRDEERAARLASSIRSLGELSDYAVGQGMTLAVENLPRTCLGKNHQEIVQILEACPALRACFDTNHNLAEDNCDFIRAVGDKIITLHVSDYDFIDEKHWLPTHGKNDWNAILSTLEAVGYHGPFMYETGTEKGTLIFADIKQNGDMLLKG